MSSKSSTQLSFSLRLSSGIKTVHLCGSWDNYHDQLPLALDKNSSKSGSWKGTFRFSDKYIKPGQRYWYYYLVDGYHCVTNPSKPVTVESTTNRELNILDMPEEEESSKSSSSGSSSSSSKHSSSKSSSKHSSSSSSKHSSSSSSSKHHSSSSSKKSSSGGSSSSSSSDRKSSRLSVDIPKGRPLSISRIKAPQPMSPYATKNILNYDDDDMNALAEQLGTTAIRDDDGSAHFASGSPDPSEASSGFRSSSPSSASGSGYSTPSSDYSSCRCERYGITRKGDRVKIDCGGTVCGYDDQSDCSSGSEDHQSSPVHRRGVVIR